MFPEAEADVGHQFQFVDTALKASQRPSFTSNDSFRIYVCSDAGAGLLLRGARAAPVPGDRHRPDQPGALPSTGGKPTFHNLA